MVRIVVVEDHAIVRNGIKMLLGAQNDLEVIADAGSGEEALAFLKSYSDVDLLLTDVSIIGMNGIDLIRAAKAAYPSLQALVLTMHDSEKFVDDAFAAGADGYLLKSSSSAELIEGINHVMRGSKYLCSELCMNMIEKRRNQSHTIAVNEQALAALSKRELEILTLIAEGLTSVEISERLFLSKRTIEGHRQNLVEKTGSKNTAALMRYAILNGLVN
ncbi:MAG: response regulator transcription factor [Flavobacteriales bacterium]|nr:MAG: response regulator transcription factor [Flavobacteriales bacterium]